jgi:putative transposase
MYEIPADVSQYSMRHLDTAFKNFVRERKKGNTKYGFPRRKVRGRCRDSFTIGQPKNRKGVCYNNVKARGDYVVIPVGMALKKKYPDLGSIRSKEFVSFNGRIINATVSRTAYDKWFISFTVEQEVADPEPPSGGAVGVDLGLTHLAILSDGRKFDNPKPLKRALRTLKRYQRAFSRKVKGSNRREKAKRKVARLHWRVVNRRKDHLHKLTTHLTDDYSVVVIENLNVSGMMKNRKLSKAIADVGWYEFRRQLEYKAKWKGAEVEVAPRFFPSTKLCSSCGKKKDGMTLSDRVYRCDNCGLVMDRDVNAAKNLEARSWRDSVNDRGADGSPPAPEAFCGEAVRERSASL